MGRLLSVVIAVGVAYVADGRVHTFQDVTTGVSGGTVMKRLYVDASQKPAMVNVDNFSCTTVGVSNDDTSVSLIIAPADDPKLEECSPKGASKSGAPIFSDLRCGNSSSHKMALAHSGTYLLYVVNCGRSPVTSTFQISGAINAHERGFSLIFFIFLMFHVCLCAAWAAAYRYKQGESTSDPVTWVIFEACVAAVLSHCAGFVSHFVSEPVRFVQVAHITLWSGTISLTMVALITVSGVGCSPPGVVCRNAYFALFFFVIAAGLTDYGNQFDKYGNPSEDDNSEAKRATRTAWAIAGSFLVFGVICVRLLARSFRCLQQSEHQEIVTFFRKMTVVIAVYTGLGVVSARCMAYDIPGNKSNSWGFHIVAGCVVTELTQGFGLGVTILMLWQTSLHVEFGVSYKSVEALPGDEEAIIHHTDAHELQDDCVVYGQ